MDKFSAGSKLPLPKKAIALLTGVIALLSVVSSCVLVRQKTFRNSLKKSAMASTNFTERVKFSLNPWMVVEAKLNRASNSEKFILDTGSPCTYSFKTKDEFSLKTNKFMRVGKYKADYGWADAQLGNITFRNLQFLAMDFDLFKWYNVAGILGVNAMQNSIWEINFRDSIITISDSLANFKNLKNAFKTKFKPYSEQQTPVVKLLINNKDTVTAFIDTGEPEFLKFNSDFDISTLKAKQPETIKTEYYDIDSKGKKLKQKSVFERNYIKLSSLKIGDLALDSFVVEKIPSYKGKNCLGLNFLKNFIVTIDFKNYNLYLSPIGKTRFNTNIFSYGFEWTKFKDHLGVGCVLRGSLAEQLGIKCGDKIIKVNNHDAKDIDKNTLQWLSDDLPSNNTIVLMFKDRSEEITLKKVSIFNR
jgi:hypothetical protein